MPFYEYKCKNCGHKHTVMQGIKDAPLVHCDECGMDTLTKLISKTGFDLKGAGWCGTTQSNNAKSQEKAEKTALTPSCQCNSCPHKP